MFQGGADKFFEGKASMMVRLLVDTILPLPVDTCLFPGHEYTVSNLTFAALAEPGNKSVMQRLAWAANQRAQGQSTVPSTLLQERKWNPFVRAVLDSDQHHHDLRSLRVRCGTEEPEDAVAVLRLAKDDKLGLTDAAIKYQRQRELRQQQQPQ